MIECNEMCMDCDAVMEGRCFQKNSIWHPMTIKPAEGKEILVQILGNGRDFMEVVHYDKQENVFLGMMCFYGEDEVLKWCYTDDILPDEGHKFTLTVTEKDVPDYRYQEDFFNLSDAQNKMKEMYHNVAIEMNPGPVDKAGLYDRSAIVYLADGNIIEWDIE